MSFYTSVYKKFQAYIYLKSITDMSSLGVMSERSFQTGFSSIRAHKSHSAFIIAAVARCITPFSGPT